MTRQIKAPEAKFDAVPRRNYANALDGLDIAEEAMLAQAVRNAFEPDHPWPEWYWHWRGVAADALGEALAKWDKWKGER